MKRYWVYRERDEKFLAGPFDDWSTANMCRDALEEETDNEYIITNEPQ